MDARLSEFAALHGIDPAVLDGWFEERAAVREIDGGMGRDAAEDAAVADVIGMFAPQVTQYRGGLMVTMEHWDG